MNLISVVQQLPKEDIETIQGYVEMIEEENQKLKLQLSGTTFCFDEEEYRVLKKQLENCYCNRTDCAGRIKDSKKYDSLVQAQEAQQKEFIKYLEDEIQNCEAVSDLLFNSNREMKVYKEILKKYKEIVNGTEQN